MSELNQQPSSDERFSKLSDDEIKAVTEELQKSVRKALFSGLINAFAPRLPVVKAIKALSDLFEIDNDNLEECRKGTSSLNLGQIDRIEGFLRKEEELKRESGQGLMASAIASFRSDLALLLPASREILDPALDDAVLLKGEGDRQLPDSINLSNYTIGIGEVQIQLPIRDKVFLQTNKGDLALVIKKGRS